MAKLNSKKRKNYVLTKKKSLVGSTPEKMSFANFELLFARLGYPECNFTACHTTMTWQAKSWRKSNLDDEVGWS